jgi:nucleosome binding factor SPN SPT16 subunit
MEIPRVNKTPEYTRRAIESYRARNPDKVREFKRNYYRRRVARDPEYVEKFRVNTRAAYAKRKAAKEKAVEELKIKAEEAALISI